MTSVESDRVAALLRSAGAHVHEGLELFGRRAGGERGVFAIARISKGELLLRLPRRAVMAGCDGGAEDCGWMPEEARGVSPILRAALCLLREQGLGAASSWAPYIDTLPAAYDTLEHWSQRELEALRGTSVHDELSGLRDPASGDLIGPAQALWKKSILPIVAAAPQHWPDASLGAFLRAVAAVRTRGFFDTAEGGGGPYLLPAIDMLNHARERTATSLCVERNAASEAAAAGSAGGSGAGAAGDVAAGEGGSASDGGLVFSMVAERSIEAGEEITHTYDHFDDAQLLLTYGFVSTDGEGALPTTAKLRLQQVLGACEAVRDAHANGSRGDRRLPWGLSEGWDDRAAACAKLAAPYGGVIAVSAAEPLPDVLLTVPILLMMPHEDFVALMSDGADGDGEGGGADGGGRVPLLDRSALDGEPTLAATVVEAIVAALDAAEARYAADEQSAPGEQAAAAAEAAAAAREGGAASATGSRRLAAARTLRDAEIAALRAARREAMRLLVTVGLGEDDEDEDEDEEDEDDEDDDGEEEEGESESSGEEEEGVDAESAAKRRRAA